MANNFIDVVTQAQAIATAFSADTVRPFKPKYIFDALAQERKWDRSNTPMPHDVVVFPVLGEVSTNTASLSATVTSITGSVKTTYTRKSVPLELYGDHSTVDVLQVPAESFINVVSDTMWQLMDQGQASINKLAKNEMYLNQYSNLISGTLSSTYHYYGSNGTASSMGPLKSVDVRQIVSDLRNDNVPTFEDNYYMAIISPEQYSQLRAETGNAAWTEPHLYTSDNSQIFKGEIGAYEGVRFVINSQVEGAGTGTLGAIFLGSDYTGKAVGKDLEVKTKSSLDGPHDNLLTLHWHALVGYKIIRRESGRIISTTNTVL